MSQPTRAQLEQQLAALSDANNSLYNRDFLLTWELSDQTIGQLLQVAQLIEGLYRNNIALGAFDSGLALSIFRDKSTRTRYSYTAACNLVGLTHEELEETKSQVTHGETLRETATMIGFLTEIVGIRDDVLLGVGHKYMTDFAAALEDSYKAGVLAQRPGLINLQCDLDHPTQSLSDLRHLAETFGGLSQLRGKKIAMTWAYSPTYGKPLSVPQGIVALMTRFGMDVVLAHPPGYELLDEPLDAARKFAAQSGGSFSQAASMDEAFDGADIIYPKSWAPRETMERRPEATQKGGSEALAQLEREALAQNAAHTDWECNAENLKKTKDGKALYMHCLPADISGVSCAKGEVSADVFERYRLATYREAGYKPFIIAAAALCLRFERPQDVLAASLKRGAARRAG
ncbi:MAG: knotted carbamoyltransferase YgeW [Deltaproteobacteria bacterium]|nr:knotted carbamoyltransferase YgeW [Deltaproteobacteria bacterium]